MSDDRREIDNQLQKFKLGKWSKEVYDYWNDKGDTVEGGDGEGAGEGAGEGEGYGEGHGYEFEEVKDEIDRINTQIDDNTDIYGDEIDHEEFKEQ